MVGILLFGRFGAGCLLVVCWVVWWDRRLLVLNLKCLVRDSI